MTSHQFSRRNFLASSLTSSCLVLSMPAILSACSRANQARLAGADFGTLSATEANELDAMAARIIPSDESPGAKEAGVIYFMDTVLGDNREEELALLRSGLGELQAQVRSEYGSDWFYELSAGQQDALLRANENTAFFNMLRFLTVAGMFSLPEYGGNRNGAGYQLIGFDNRFAWAPPFGYYDADYRERGQ